MNQPKIPVLVSHCASICTTPTLMRDNAPAQQGYIIQERMLDLDFSMSIWLSPDMNHIIKNGII